MKVLIDTNVVIDALTDREPWAQAAQELLRMAAMGTVRCCVTASQVTDIFYLLGRGGLGAAAAKAALKKLAGVLTVVGVAPADVDDALASPMPDFEDALLACCAKRQKATYVVTRDAKGFQQSPVPALTPQALLDALGPNRAGA